MAGKGDIAKIALDAIIRPATIPLVTPEVGTKISRGVFKDMLKQLGETRSYYRDRGNKLQYSRRQYPEPHIDNRFSPNYGKQTEQRFAAIDNILKKRNTDPTEFITNAVSTGKIDGMKLSSKERNELAQRLALINMYKKGPEFVDYRYNANPVDIYRYGQYTTEPGLAEKALKRLHNKWLRPESINTVSKNDADILSNMSRRLYDEKELGQTSNLPLVDKGWYRSTEDAIKKAIGLKGEYGRGWNNVYYNNDLLRPIIEKMVYNTLISKYNITNPKQAEALVALRPEWQGTDEELVALVRMLNP